MNILLPAIEIETAPKPEFAVIWLHGLGADGSDFAPAIPFLRLPADLAVRFIFPHAQEIRVTCNGGYIMPAWYDIIEARGIEREVDEVGILSSRSDIRRLIDRENQRGIPCENIVLAGFSQGGAMAYTVGLTHPQPLAGVVALSAYIPAPSLLTEVECKPNRATPLFVGHGAEDDIVPLALGSQAQDFLHACGYDLSWRLYPMDHTVSEDELAEVGAWLAERFRRTS